MLSSTSNSNERAPRLSYLRLWLTAAGLALLLLGGWEGFWRARGFAPMPNDDAGWWARSRRAADHLGPDGVVLLGSSRMQLGLDTGAFASATGIHPVQLAISLNSGIPVLRDLADDPAFRGTVICEVSEANVVTVDAEPVGSRADEWLREYHTQNVFDRFEWRMRGAVQTKFAFRLTDLSSQNLAGNLRFGRLPRRPYGRMLPDRSRQADYAQSDLPVLSARNQAYIRDVLASLPPITPAEFVARGQRLREVAAKIEARGGRVIFVRFPTSGQILEWEVARFPKSDYWDALAAVDRLTVLHYADYASLKDFSCPDGTHLDYRDSARFTTALVTELRKKDLLPAAWR